jgi:hypothetical protein
MFPKKQELALPYRALPIGHSVQSLARHLDALESFARVHPADSALANATN